MEAAGEPTGWATVCEANRLGLLKKGWGTMTAIARKVQIGTAACAIAVAAALTPAAVAQADPAVPVPTGSLGGSAGANSSPAVNISQSISASNTGPGTIFVFQNVGWFENVNFQILINVQSGGYGHINA